jgi:hypothetical protein
MALETLAVKADATTNAIQVWRVLDTTLDSQIGSDVQTGVSLGPGQASRLGPLVINAWGTLWCIGKDGLYKYDASPTVDAWSKVWDAGENTNNVHNLGPYYIVINNIPYLIGLHGKAGGATGSTKGFKYNLLTGATTVTADTSLGAGAMGEGVLFESNLWFSNYQLSGSLRKVCKFDPVTMIISVFNQSDAGSARNNPSLCVFENQLYALGGPAGGVGQNIELFKFSEGAMNSFLSIDSVTQSSFAFQHGALFTDGANMYAIYWQHSPRGWKIRALSPSGSSIVLGSELTNVVMPALLRPGGGAAIAIGADDYNRWIPLITNRTDGTREIYLYHVGGDTAVDSFTLYRWVDENTEMVQVHTAGGLVGNMWFPLDSNGGGSRIYVPGAPEIVIYGKEAVAGGERLTFRCFGGQLGQTVRIFLGSGGDIPDVQASLIGAATGGGAFRNGNQVDNVDCDGTTDYTVTIQALGFNNLDFIETIARVSAA